MPKCKAPALVFIKYDYLNSFNITFDSDVIALKERKVATMSIIWVIDEVLEKRTLLLV